MNDTDSSDAIYSLDLQFDCSSGSNSDEENNPYLNPIFSTDSDTDSKTLVEEIQSSDDTNDEHVELIQNQYVCLKNEICHCIPKCSCEMKSQITYL